MFLIVRKGRLSLVTKVSFCSAEIKQKGISLNEHPLFILLPHEVWVNLSLKSVLEMRLYYGSSFIGEKFGSCITIKNLTIISQSFFHFLRCVSKRFLSFKQFHFCNLQIFSLFIHLFSDRHISLCSRRTTTDKKTSFLQSHNEFWHTFLQKSLTELQTTCGHISNQSI